MKTSTIADAKNNLSQLIAQLDGNEPIQLTRYGKAVAVILSQAYYQKLIQPNKKLYQAIMNWREQRDGRINIGFNDAELDELRDKDSCRDFSWAE
ncbi:type II toxin-antitoxin system Phd/YefM family antitoxin [Methylomonas rivi]|uniref:Antitoxin n=1 Tax=Methylomonas rivi TaxID=2952226 RepID=A0ABT1U9J8_9GAMM|nr:type II toxin-antitoxin system Phd/YefM family antitoxin [Methylomonas sp. WSC-6]MCQ8130544.1 type II toxin-antitoxin system Phd/YefM family antitoxin [Methylomonas sp. WSC-6]